MRSTACSRSSGPSTFPEYGVTVQPGEVTMTLLGATRGTERPSRAARTSSTRWPSEVVTRLLALPPERWEETLAALAGRRRRQRSALAWLADEEAQRSSTRLAGLAAFARSRATTSTSSSRTSHRPPSTTSWSIAPTRCRLRLDEDGDGRQPGSASTGSNEAGETGEPYRIAARVLQQPAGLVRRLRARAHTGRAASSLTAKGGRRTASAASSA